MFSDGYQLWSENINTYSLAQCSYRVNYRCNWVKCKDLFQESQRRWSDGSFCLWMGEEFSLMQLLLPAGNSSSKFWETRERRFRWVDPRFVRGSVYLSGGFLLFQVLHITGAVVWMVLKMPGLRDKRRNIQAMLFKSLLNKRSGRRGDRTIVIHLLTLLSWSE